MLKKILHVSVLAVFMLSAAPKVSAEETTTDTPVSKEKPPVKKAKKKQKKPSKKAPVKAASDDDNDEDKTSAQPKEAYGPFYPFIYENKNAEQLTCKTTPFVVFGPENKKPIRKGNNLMRKAGSPLKAEGSFIQIMGRIVDENCLPIQGAVVEIWQADSLGNYEWEYDTDSYWHLPLEGKDKNFLFSGTAQTDNLGQFDFETILPGPKEDSAPHINIIVKRSGYEGLQTRMYFASHPLNNTDPVLTAIQGSGREHLIARGQNISQYVGRIFYFPITISGISPYKRF